MSNLMVLPTTLTTNIKKNYLSEEDRDILKLFKERADNNKVTTEAYKYVDTEEIVSSVGDFLSSIGHTFSAKIVTGAAQSSTKHIAEFTVDSMPLMLSDGGGAGKILIINGYNGETSLTIMGGAIRFCCANGIISGKSEIFEKIRHRVGQTIDDKLKALNDKILVVCEYLENNFGKKVEEMAKIEVSYVEEVRVILSLDIPKRVKFEVIEKIHPSNRHLLREQDRSPNAWTLYNVINECITSQAKHGIADFESNENLMDSLLSKVA